MAYLFGVCAVVGGTVMLCQFALTLLGLADTDDIDFPDDDGPPGDGDHHDGHAHHGSDWFFGVITFRTVVAALTFFGLAGLAARSADLGQREPVIAVVIAVAAGAAAMYGVHWMMQGLHRLRSEGTVRIERAVGRHGSVYLRIPAARSGVGKVTVSVQGRLAEFQATTAGDLLPTGAKIVVVGVVGPETVDVELTPEPEPETSSV